ncbi:MAG: STAS domain-containing protein [Actinomycetes bacterium]
MDLEISSSRRGGACVVTLVGEVDVYTAPALRISLVDATESGCSAIIVDMSDVDFIDSSGLGVLVSILKRVSEQDSTLTIVSDREIVLKVFRVTGLDRVFPIVPTLAEATGPGA